MFHKIFVEDEVKDHWRTSAILKNFSSAQMRVIDRIDHVFGKVKKPYLHKRTHLNLYVGKKRGVLIKPAPQAYGVSLAPHYYFIHAYNCPYECEYCYLQGYFSSPDLVIFINHEEIGEEIKRLALEHEKAGPIWFHGGEFSDSLALASLTGELPFYFDLFKDLPWARLELRTKSIRISPLQQLPPQENVIVSYSLGPEEQVKDHDRKTPPLKSRLKAIKALVQRGHPVGVHLDPIIYHDEFERHYRELLEQFIQVLPPPQLQYISLGVIRFTKRVYREVKRNYPGSSLLAQDFVKSVDGKLRYNDSLKKKILRTLKKICLEKGISEEKIYLCMEDEDDFS